MEQLISNDNGSNFENQSPFYKYQHKVTPENFELIDVAKTKYDKKILVIYNPKAGKSNDRTEEIGQKLKENNIKYEV